ncbi:hypothetical protein C0992_012902 [Termitomyces sp. T32_za158]|nr:hypothetical protein C0992_012902 [Termitomyces sp. T32_za158]
MTVKITTTQGTPLPYDLQDLIIGHLREDPKSLAACSLVSSLWSDLARILLFSRLQAQIAYNGYSEDEARITELITLLEAPNSRLGQYIHRISIDGSDDFFIIDDTRAYQLGYDMVFSALRRIVPRLSRIDALEIKAFTWCCVSRDAQIQIAIMSEVKSLSLSHIHVDLVDDLFHFSFKTFPKLEEFQVSEIGAKEVPAFCPTMFLPHANRIMSLRKLVIFIEESTMPLVLALTNNIISVQNINTLDVEFRKMTYFCHVDSLLKTIGPTLTTLTLWLNLDYTNVEGMQYDLNL